ncbi:hypothetical protein PsorP6_000348 [Peronosclerospora sorghi]|uniref:Uncharacterized protein n=1 Tax=Peronosclerospora sorghi TaxID=230839 RepID=A0ACC0WUB2_9STRA|nr:hypothetical protein PsorP6_000348 [Peronosclerospora sorghi]
MVPQDQPAVALEMLNKFLKNQTYWVGSCNGSDIDDEDVLDEELGPVSGKCPFGGKGEAIDVLLPSGEACGLLNKLLARAKQNRGEFTFGGFAGSLPSAPGMFVNGVGEIQFRWLKSRQRS